MQKFESQGRWVVGSDGSPAAAKAVSWAAHRLSQRTVKAPLLILHCIPESPIPSASKQEEIAAELGHKDQPHLAAERDLVAHVQSLAASHPELSVETAVVLGHPAEVLATAAADADQVIVGSHGHGSGGLRQLLGGTAEHVVMDAQGSVAVIPEDAHENDEGPVVLGIDDSQWGRLAKARAFQAASLRGVGLTVILAWGDKAGSNAPRTEQEARDIAEQLVDNRRAEYPDVEVTILTPRTSPDRALVEASERAGLLVMGSRGRGGFTGLRLGSTTRSVLRGSKCPVVVARADAGWNDHAGRVVPAAH
ncbi:universal stress protein [Luteococcus sediminum]